MRQAKVLFLVTLSLFLLAAAYRVLGVQPADAQAGQAGEVAVLTGTLPDGGMIPLPHYADGTEALEGESYWTVSANDFNTAPNGNMTLHCSSEGRIAHVWWCARLDGGTGACIDVKPGIANYMIVAVRHSAPTRTGSGSLGEFKAHYGNHATGSR